MNTFWDARLITGRCHGGWPSGTSLAHAASSAARNAMVRCRQRRPRPALVRPRRPRQTSWAESAVNGERGELPGGHARSLFRAARPRESGVGGVLAPDSTAMAVPRLRPGAPCRGPAVSRRIPGVHAIRPQLGPASACSRVPARRRKPRRCVPPRYMAVLSSRLPSGTSLAGTTRVQQPRTTPVGEGARSGRKGRARATGAHRAGKRGLGFDANLPEPPRAVTRPGA